MNGFCPGAGGATGRTFGISGYIGDNAGNKRTSPGGGNGIVFPQERLFARIFFSNFLK